MDQKIFLAALPPTTKVRLIAKSDQAGLWQLAGHAGAIIVCATLIAAGVPGWWILVPIQGVLISFLFSLEHEATHKTPFASARLNESVGHICGFLLILPFEWFRYFHLAHHRHTNIADQDPELDGPALTSRKAWLWHVSGLPYWAAEVKLMGALVQGRATARYLPIPALAKIVSGARLMAVGYGLVAMSLFFSTLLFWVWLLPALIGQPALRLYLLAEHGDCPRVANMFENTRTTVTNRIIRALAWNMPYHVEHHVYPAVPFHQLPTLHTLMQAELRVTAEGYAAFTKDYLARRM